MGKDFEFTRQPDIPFGAALETAREEIGVATKGKSVATKQTKTQVEPSVREELMKLVQRLFLTPGQAPPKAVMLAGIDARTQCSRLSAITAELLAESVSGSVCLVDGNFRNPSLPGMFGMNNNVGLADSLRQKEPVREFAKQVGHGILWLLSSGSVQQEDALNLLNSDRMKERIAELRSEFDYLLITVPPLNVYADAMVFGRLVDGAVLVLEANATRRESALRAAESLRNTRIPVLGAVLNGRTYPIPGTLYKRL